VLIASWGFDGMTNQSQYKQKFDVDEEDRSDAGLLVTTVIQLQLRDVAKCVVWANQAPQSVRFCRPFRIQFLKESERTILAEKD